MKKALCFLLVAAATACAGTEPPSTTPSNPTSQASRGGSTSAQAADDPARPLTASECESLGQSLSDACNGRADARTATVDGWCSDLVSGVGDGSWASDCVKHMKYMDSVCFQSATNARGMMDCDKVVNR